MRILNQNLLTLVISLLLVIYIPGCNNKNKTTETSSPAKALESFELAEGFQIELVANEPLIADPVAMEIDEQGRMYVVQMHGYPLDKSGSGSVKLLSDTDGDGLMDQSVTFADDLVLPNGITRWKKGILVTDAPNVLYFEDTDGDGKADVRDTLLTGFALSNPQHKVNTPIYGLDNWIHLANEPVTVAKIYADEFGDKGQKIRFPHLPQGPVLPENANGRRVRFRPDRAGLEMLSSATQFSNAQDVWGRQFLGNNTQHIVHEVIRAKYLERNPHLQAVGSTQKISTYGMPADVYPITENPEHQIFTSIGVFTSACGVVLYGGGLFPEPFSQVAFVAEPVSNIIHACRLDEDGATFKATRLYEKKEFLASKDPWFRPVNHYVGPDGALYVIDYHRRYIEHPEWMGDDVIQSGALYEGKDKGRIYRITPSGTPKASWIRGLNLAEASDTQLIDYLSHSNQWYRKTAQRLLVDRQDKKIVNQLLEVVRSNTSSYGRLHAAWTLEGLEAVTPEVITVLLKDREAGLRTNGILLAETLWEKHPELTDQLLALKSDKNSQVRFQLLCTLGDKSAPDVSKVRDELLFADSGNEWMQTAALSAQQPNYSGILNQSIRIFEPGNTAQAQLIQSLSSMYATQSGANTAKALIKQALNSKDRHKGAWQSAILTGLARRGTALNFEGGDFENERLQLLNAVFQHASNEVRTASLELLKRTGLPGGKTAQVTIDRCIAIVKSDKATPEERQLAINLLSISNPQTHQELFYGLIQPSQPLEIQKAALKVLGESGGTDIATYLRDHWQNLSPQLRDMAIAIFLKGEQRTAVLVEALEAGTIDPSSVSFYRQIYLMTLPDEKMRKRTRLLFKDQSKDAERQNVIAKYKAALTKKGDYTRGEVVFKKNCSVCHQMGGELGTAYGPDLGTIRNRRAESILTDILDPALSIADGYDLWEIELANNGGSKQGIIASETPTTIALSIYGGQQEVISRQDISSIRALGVTIMPTGLEKSITEGEMVDLISFIRRVK